MKIYYFVGTAHHKVHMKFYHSVLGGEFVYAFDDTHDISYDKILQKDSIDAVWMFTNWYPRIHPLLKGKQIFIEHGLSFKPSLNNERVVCLNQYFDLIFSSGVSQRDYMIQKGVNQNKIYEIGYTTLFEVPLIQVQKRTVLFSFVCFGDWNEYENLINIIKRLPKNLEGFVTMHPSLPQHRQHAVRMVSANRSNITLLESQESLLEAYAYCSCIVGGSSSVCTPFWYFKKPVILIRGKQGRNPFAGWGRIKKKVNYPLFSVIVDESTKIFHWRQFKEKTITHARFAPSSKKMFFSTNWDKEETIECIKHALARL